MIDTIFTKIIKGEIPSYKIAEDENNFAFLDINPLAKGHTLVISKKQVDYIFDLSDDDLVSLHLFAKKVAKAMDKSIECERIGMAVIGLEVPHTHIHLIPINNVGDIDFSQPKKSFSPEEMQSIAKKIATNL